MTSSVAIAFEQFALEKTRLLKLETLRAKNLTKALLNGTGGNRQWRVSPDTELPEDFYTLAIQLGWGEFDGEEFQVSHLGKQIAHAALEILTRDSSWVA